MPVNTLKSDRNSIALEDLTNNEINPATEENQIKSSEEAVLLRRLVKLMESNATVDPANRQRIIVENQVAVLPSAYYAGANQFNIPNSTVFAPLNNSSATYVQPVQTGPVDPRWQIIDQARLVYNQGVRSHLSFT